MIGVYGLATLTKRFASVQHGLTLAGRGNIRATGEDRVRLLHSMTTNDIQTLVPGAGCYTFFLTAQGRIHRRREYLRDAGLPADRHRTGNQAARLRAFG